jgi:hypothetical protein
MYDPESGVRSPQIRPLMRRMFDDIKAAHGEHATVHVFPVAPVSAAVDLRAGEIRLDRDLMRRRVDFDGFRLRHAPAEAEPKARGTAPRRQRRNSLQKTALHSQDPAMVVSME